MEWEDEDTLCRQLADADASLYFLILLILSVCLSWACLLYKSDAADDT